MVAARRTGSVPASVNQLRFDRDELLAVHKEILAAPAAARAKLAGLDAGRADIIPAGSLFLLTAMEVFGFEQLTVGEWALREGIVLDAIRHHDAADWSGDPHAIRRASVARLATALFDQTVGLHGLGTAERELLEHASLLHDIGAHVSTESHHKHTAYLIQHGRLRGFSPDEVAVLAALGRFHRGGDPRTSREPMTSLPPEWQEKVPPLAALLRIADGLDRSRSGAVRDAQLQLNGSRARLAVTSARDVDVDVWGARRKRELFEKVFDRRLEVIGG
jgi:exopolyphosphatase/guanosine-5'-triphosphate,3'-diphosphate pyrophosphatase